MRYLTILILFVMASAGCQQQEAATTQQAPANAPAQAAQQALNPKARATAQKLFDDGKVYINNRQLEKAVLSFRAANEVDPQFLPPYLTLSELYLRLGRNTDAASILEKAANVAPGDGLVFYLLAMAEHQADRNVQAILAARRSAEIFQARKDEEGLKRAVSLMQQLVALQQKP